MAQLILEAYDPGTTRRLLLLGVREGWHCAEIGSPGGSIARWLSACVGRSGRVIESDVEALEDQVFDLVHCRDFLGRVKAPAEALDRMVSALRPSGILLAEELGARTLPAMLEAAGLIAVDNEVSTRITSGDVEPLMVAAWGRKPPA